MSASSAPQQPGSSAAHPAAIQDAAAAGVPQTAGSAAWVVPRWVQAVTVPLAALGVWGLLRAAGGVLILFLVASVIALILNPLVRLLQRGRLPRGLAVLAVYSGFLAAFVGAGILLANPIAGQVEAFQRDVPGLVNSANRSLARLQTHLDAHNIRVQVKEPGETALQTLQKNVLRGSGDVVSFTRDLLTRLVETSLALILVIVLSIYLLLYGERIGNLVRRVMPPGDGGGDDYPLRVQKAVSGYVRAQLLFSLVMGASAGAGLWLLGVIGVFPQGQTYGLFFGGFYGLMELIPYIGPVLGALPPIIVGLLNDPLSALWLALFFVILQQLEGHVVAPQLFGHSLRINPVLIILALLVGNQLYGIIGALIALPLAAVVRETVLYLRRHLVLEPWGTPTAASLGAHGALPPVGAAADPSGRPDSASADEVSDARCRACGAPVESEALATQPAGRGGG